MDVGRLSYWLDRSRARSTWINTIMIGYLFIERAGFQWWYLLVIPAFFIFMYFDIKYILPKEREYGITRSKTIRDIYKITAGKRR